MNAGFQQQRPFAFTAAVRSTPSPQQAANLRLNGHRGQAGGPALDEEKSFAPQPER